MLVPTELTLLSVGMDRISANIWSSHSQACILPIMLDQTLAFDYLQEYLPFGQFGEGNKEAIHRAVFGKAQSFRKSED